MFSASPLPTCRQHEEQSRLREEQNRLQKEQNESQWEMLVQRLSTIVLVIITHRVGSVSVMMNGEGPFQDILHPFQR